MALTYVTAAYSGKRLPALEFILDPSGPIRSTLDTVSMIVHNDSISWFLTFVPPDGDANLD